MNALFVVLLFAAEPTLQFDISGGATGPAHEDETPDEDAVGKRDASQAAAYLGVAFESDRSSGFFVGTGVEGTVDGKQGPYQWSVGFGPRIGYVWREGRKSLDPFPNGYLYARATPFLGMRTIADEAYLHDDSRRLTQAGGGIRLGVGFTAPAWSALMLDALSEGPDLSGMTISGGGGNLAGAAVGVLGCIVIGAAIVLFNHVELTYESYYAAGMPTDHRVGIRFGTGF